MKAPYKILFLTIAIFLIGCLENLKAQEQLKDKVFLIGNGLKKATNLDWSTKENQKRQALYIHNYILNIEWPNATELSSFNIAVLGDSNNLVYDELLKIAETKKARELPIHVERLQNLNNLDHIQLIYFDRFSNLKLEEAYKSIGNKHILLVTQGYPYGKSMINFIMDGDKVQYELNEKKCESAGLKVSKLLTLVAVKSEKEWASLIDKIESLSDTDDETVKIDTKDLHKIIREQKRLLNEIESNAEKIEIQKDKLKHQLEELSIKESQLRKTKEEIVAQKSLIDEQLYKIKIQQHNLDSLNKNVVIKHKELVDQQKVLDREAQNLIAIQKEYQKIETSLKNKELLVGLQGETITAQDNEITTKSDKIEEQKSIIWLSILFLLIVSVLGIMAYRSYRLKNAANILIVNQKEEIEEQHNVLEEQHREITDSINYAKRIQHAILPPVKLVKKHLPNSFIFYKPKDIVAGDFYWMQNNGKKTLIAAADCTGHGVPGAMVSVVCNNGLNRSIREYKLTDPGKILDKTREIVIQEFEKSDEEVKDGMDIALCSLENTTLQYAGAHNPLWIIRPNSGKTDEQLDKISKPLEIDGFTLYEVKANKQPIGKFDKIEPYTTHTIELNKGDSIYLFSDGYVDQFGGEKGKKLKSANFKKLLLSLQNNSMEKQHELISSAFEDWKGNIDQLDDVCVIGVKV